MSNINKLKVILLAFLIVFTSNSIAEDRILPKNKPIIDVNLKTELEKEKAIYPQKKPSELLDSNLQVSKEDKKNIDQKEANFIYPKKKTNYCYPRTRNS